jgi:homoserine dehydrogenase
MGFAEADPSADVDGLDACRKICILANLAYGRLVRPELVQTEGIRNISVRDVEALGTFGAKIKLIGRAIKKGARLMIWVAPHVLLPGNPLLNVENAYNGIIIRGNVLGDAMFFGCGAGSLPTASAVIADMSDAVRHSCRRLDIGWSDGGEGWIASGEAHVSRWYVRRRRRDERAYNPSLDAGGVLRHRVKYRILE